MKGMGGISISQSEATKVLSDEVVESFREKFCKCIPPTPLPRGKKERRRVVSQFLSDTTALGYGVSVCDIHAKICKNLGMRLEAVRVEVVHRRRKKLWTMYMCNEKHGEVLRPRPKEEALVLVTLRHGHCCKAQFAIVGIVLWRALSADEADAAWLFLKKDVILKPGFKRLQRDKIERGNGRCKCNQSGCGTIIVGCYGHAIHHICSILFRGQGQFGKIALEDPADPDQVGRASNLQSLMNDLADKVGGWYRAVAPKAFRLQISRLASAPSCQLGNELDGVGNPYAAGSVVYGSVHCHKDKGDAELSCAAVLSLCPDNRKDEDDPITVSVLHEYSLRGAAGKPVGLYLPHGTIFISPAKYMAHGTTPIHSSDPLARLSCVFFLNQDIGRPEHAKAEYDAIMAKEARERKGSNDGVTGRKGLVPKKGGPLRVKKPESPCVTYVCPHCSRGYDSKRALTRHLKDMHSGKYECSLCSASFPTVFNLTRHVKNLHEPEGKGHKCPKCARTYKYKHNMRVHLNSVHSEDAEGARNACSQCSKSYTYKATLQMHLREVHGLLYECERCGKRFAHLKSLRAHRKVGCQVDTGKGKESSEPEAPYGKDLEGNPLGVLSGAPYEAGGSVGSVIPVPVPSDASQHPPVRTEVVADIPDCQVSLSRLLVPADGNQPAPVGQAAATIEPVGLTIPSTTGEGNEPIPIDNVVVEIETSDQPAGMPVFVLPTEGEVPPHGEVLPALQRIMRGPGAQAVVKGLVTLPPDEGEGSGASLPHIHDQLGVLQAVEQLVGRADIVSILQDVVRLLTYFAKEPASRDILNTVIQSLTEARPRAG